MKVVYLFTIALLFTANAHHQEVDLKLQYSEFKEKYNKVYSIHEDIRRFAIFKENLANL